MHHQEVPGVAAPVLWPSVDHHQFTKAHPDNFASIVVGGCDQPLGVGAAVASQHCSIVVAEPESAPTKERASRWRTVEADSRVPAVVGSAQGPAPTRSVLADARHRDLTGVVVVSEVHDIVRPRRAREHEARSWWMWPVLHGLIVEEMVC